MCRAQAHQIYDRRAASVSVSVQRLTLSLINTAVMERYHWWLHTGGWLPRSTWPVSYGETGHWIGERHRAEVQEPCCRLEMRRNGPRH